MFFLNVKHLNITGRRVRLNKIDDDDALESDGEYIYLTAQKSPKLSIVVDNDSNEDVSSDSE